MVRTQRQQFSLLPSALCEMPHLPAASVRVTKESDGMLFLFLMMKLSSLSQDSCTEYVWREFSKN